MGLLETIFHGARKPIKIWDVDVDNIVISNLIKTKKNSMYLIGYLDDAKNSSMYLLGYLDSAIRQLVLILLKWVNMFDLLKIKTEIKIRIKIIN